MTIPPFAICAIPAFTLNVPEMKITLSHVRGSCYIEWNKRMISHCIGKIVKESVQKVCHQQKRVFTNHIIMCYIRCYIHLCKLTCSLETPKKQIYTKCYRFYNQLWRLQVPWVTHHPALLLIDLKLHLNEENMAVRWSAKLNSHQNWLKQIDT